MSEMLDQIRKEIHERGGYDTPWETCSQCEDAARAVLLILRDPTDTMLAAGRIIDIRALRTVGSIFSAMIDEALK